MVPDFEILSLSLCLEPITLRWGGQIVARFTLSCGPFLVSKAQLIQCPDKSFATSIAHIKGGGRVVIIDTAVRDAVIEAATAAYERAIAPPLLHAVPPVAKASTTAGTEHDPP